MIEATKTTSAVAMLVAAAVAAPTAAARPADGAVPARAPKAAVRTVEVPASGFHWGDAGLGAAVTLTLLGAGAGAAVIGRRARTATG